jgi:hypothetical protein
MKKTFWTVTLLSFFLLLVVSSVQAFGGPAPKPSAPVSGLKGNSFLIDNFESGSLKTPRDWWVFDLRKAEAISNFGLDQGEKKVVSEIGRYSLHLAGEATNWYAGGCGTYFAKENQDLSAFNYLQFDAYGFGEGSGNLKIELLDDDNNNWQVEQDAARGYAPTNDDKFVYSLTIDWTGWKRISIPLSDFVDDNPGVGDNIWNPTQANGSGGLLQLQFICVTPKEKGKIDFYLDNVYLTNTEL